MASEPLSDFVSRLPQERRAEANYLRKRLKSLGDRVGPNDMRLSEALWQASEIVRVGLKGETVASEPEVGDVRNGNDGWEMFIGSAWVWIGERAEDHDAALHISAELSAAREMREVLKHLEWSGIINDYDYCPVCNGNAPDHAPDCRLARLIGGGE